MPKIVDHEKVQRQLVSGCVELFAARGYAALTMREAAKGLGVSTGTLYHYFPSKQALFMAVVQHVVELDTFGVDELLALDPVDRLDAVLRYVDRHRARFLQHVMVLTEVVRLEEEAGPVLQAVRAASQAYVLGLMALLQLPSPGAARMILATINGVMLHDLFEGQPLSPTRFADLAPAIRGMLNGLST